MALSRYALSKTVKGGKGLSTGTGMSKIYNACIANDLAHEVYVTKENQRLDHLAGLAYQSSSLLVGYCSCLWNRLGIASSTRGQFLRIPVSVAEALGYL